MNDSALASLLPPAYGFSVKLMQFLVVPTFVLDAKGRVIIWNVACERLTGLPASEILGTRQHWKGFYESERPCLADLVLEESQSSDMQSLYAEHEHPAGGSSQGLSAENWCHMPRRGVELYLAIDAGPIYDDHGELIAVVETLRDITLQKRSQTELERLATSDGLTGILNRRAFDQRLESACQWAAKEQSPLSLLMIDVDHFKPFNDIYGHQAGDDCLKKVANTLATSVHRAGDVVARYGGEEFAVILPGTPQTHAIKVGKRLCDEVQSLHIPHRGNASGVVTISIGASCLQPAEASHGAALLSLADQALYQAKRNGRARVQGSAQPRVRDLLPR